MSDKIINVYKIYPNDVMMHVDKAEKSRYWMDSTNQAYAYRCLPLSIANQHGWVIIIDYDTSFYWDGGQAYDSVKILSGPPSVSSIFGSGIVTFNINYLISLPENYNLFIGGIPNSFKPDIQALTAIYEADWAPYTFTMNWKITKPNEIINFNKGEPVCFFFPIPRNLIEEFDINMDVLSNNSDLNKKFNEFNESRNNFINNLHLIDNPTDGWQKHYFQGKYPDGSKCPFDHKTKLNLKDIKEI